MPKGKGKGSRYGWPMGKESVAHSSRTGLPDRMEVPLRYCDTMFISPGALTYAGTHTYRLNSLYDPDYTGGGHQPLFFDQWSALYGRYRVDRCLMELNIGQASAASDSVVGYGANNNLTDLSTSLGITNMIEAPFSDFSVIGTGATQVCRKFRKMFDLRAITGVSANKYRDDDLYSAAISSNPTENIALHVFVADAGSTVPNVFYTIRLTYYATFWDRIQVGSSIAKPVPPQLQSTATSSSSSSSDIRVGVDWEQVK